MNNQSEKIHSAKSLSETENPRIIESIKKTDYQDTKDDFWNDLSINQKDEIDAAYLEIKNGDVMDFDLFMEKYR